MRVWRIAIKRFQRFDGEGAGRYGGRWNHAGTAMVYAAGSLSLAALELFVHVDTDLAPANLVAIPADLPDAVRIETVDVSDLPRNWRTYPAPEALKDIGTAWFVRGSSAVMAVPSALIPMERNYLLNPKHRDFKRVRIGKSIPFRFDPRMWK